MSGAFMAGLVTGFVIFGVLNGLLMLLYLRGGKDLRRIDHGSR